MKVFLDTNVILEFFLEREEFSTVHLLFKKLFEQSSIMYMSVGSYYTMIFLVDKYLRKELGLSGAARLLALRQIMSNILKTIHVAEHNNDSLMRGVMNMDFSDLEDSCQYELAQKVGCEYLLTFNTVDFASVETDKLQVLTPLEYINL